LPIQQSTAQNIQQYLSCDSFVWEKNNETHIFLCCII
jgi:hypothetical protein